MPAPVSIRLNDEENRTLYELSVADGVPKRTKVRALMDWQANKAAELLATSGQITVVVLDNASFHKSGAAQKHWRHWQ